MKEVFNIFKFSKKIEDLSNRAMELCKDEFLKIEKIKEFNCKKVLEAFIDCKISESHFVPTTGYGYNDWGREKIDELFAKIFKTGFELMNYYELKISINPQMEEIISDIFFTNF